MSRDLELDCEDGDDNGYDNGYENLELEKEFSALISTVNVDIKIHIDKAREELNKAIAISEKHCVPFRSNISFISNSYVPSSFKESKFTKIDNERLGEMTDIWDNDSFEYGGWQHSAVC